MNRAAILLLGILAQCLLTALFVWRVVPSIAQDIQTRSDLALSARNVNWGRVEVDGRDVTLSGLAPSQKQKQRAMDALQSVHGVRLVMDKTTSLRSSAPARARTTTDTPPESVGTTAKEDALVSAANDAVDIAAFGLRYEFRVERNERGVALRGMVPDEAVRVALLDATRAKFENIDVRDDLVINADAPYDFVRAARQAVSVAGLVASGAAGVRDQVLFVEGLTASDRDLTRLRDTIDAALPEGYDLAMQIGSRQTLAAMMRENPDLAARVGPLPGSTPADRRIDLGRTPKLDRSPEAAARCQTAINNEMTDQRINFATGSSDIASDSHELLNALITLAKACPAARIEISGHTDDQGTDENNLALSQRRAESVMEFFVRNGVKLGRLSAVGYGESQPLVDNLTSADRARNRRIEFRVL
ncbi:MAG: OmpA family protein [Gammaproteobacteria bacterium]